LLSLVVSTPLNVIILAAGQGKRMHSALPKVLHALAGKPLVTHVIDAARALSPRSICLVYGHGGEPVREALAAPDLVFALQDPPRGTGDAVRAALPQLPPDGITLVVLGDVPLVPVDSLAAVVDAARRGHLGLLTAKMADPAGLGRVLRDPYGHVRRIVEERDATPEQLRVGEINTGVIAAPTGALARWVAALKADNAQREYYLTDVIDMAVSEGVQIEAHRAADSRDVGGVNDRAQLAEAERILQRRRAETLLRTGTWIADPARFDQRGELRCGRDVRIDVGCVFEGSVELEDGVSVGAYCILKDMKVGAGTEILPFSHLEASSIGAGCRVGPYSRLRPGNLLHDQVHIGNFVELKASTLGCGAKANHLAYVGDAVLGANVNFGAGAITANYDGANKHRTIIGDDVHVGSNSVLVAPVTIGPGATIGGGSTIARDAPPAALTLTRAQQITIEGWTRPTKKKG
jgi:bifunctional UDP-N-acetylglucosamine pyrophosphorylase / glucosamine-1-phosphate N-acetyltransferase